jgi:type I restriction enzyme S subunit
MSELPTGWAQTTLSKIAAWGSGGTPSRSEPSYYGGGIPWIKTGELGPRFVRSTEESISEEGLSKSSAKLFPAGSVAIAMYGATIGKTSILGIQATTNQACAVGIPHVEATTKEYLYHFLCSQKEAFIEAGKGGAQPNISQAIIKDWNLPLAPLPEQKRIADKLDSVLARVDACRDRLDRLPALLKRFRQSILAAATSGRLTEDWRGSVALSNWATVSVKEICLSVSDGDHQAPPQATSGIPFITISAFNTGHLELHKASRFVPKEYFGSLSSIRRPARGDVLYSVTGSIGIAALVDVDAEFTFQRHVAILKPDHSRVSSAYLLHLLSSEMIKEQAQLIATGTAQLTIPLNGLRAFVINLPPANEQTEIVRRVEILFAFADRLEARLATARRQVGQLTPALLAKAFRGELVAQDPADEPAAELLQRLAAQRAEAPKAKRGRAKA